MFAVAVEISNASSDPATNRELLCAAADGQLSCRDKSTNQVLEKGDIALSLVGKYSPWDGDTTPGTGMKRALPAFPSRDPYDTCSSGHSYHCIDWCRTWVTVEVQPNCHANVFPPSAGCQTTLVKKCDDWSYKCSETGTCGNNTYPPIADNHPSAN